MNIVALQNSTFFLYFLNQISVVHAHTKEKKWNIENFKAINCGVHYFFKFTNILSALPIPVGVIGKLCIEVHAFMVQPLSVHACMLFS